MSEDAPAPGVARYDDIAALYDDAVGDRVDDAVAVTLLELLPDLKGRRVLDLACGQGRLSRELARRGARVTGIDISRMLLETAREVEARTPLGITYVDADAMSPDSLSRETFHVVTCHFGLSDIDDLPAVVANIVRWLEPKGTFIFSILHPCFPGWGADAPSSWPPGESYFSERWWRAENSGFRGKVGSNHRMLSTYLNTLIDRRLAIERVAEPRPQGEWVRRNESDDLVPVFLVVRCHRLEALNQAM